MKKTVKVSVIALLLLAIVGCKHDEVSIFDMEFASMSVPCQINSHSMEVDSANKLPIDIESNIINAMKNFEGEPYVLKTTIPSDWYLLSKVESFSDEFDIWLIASEGEPIYKVLATVDLSKREVISAIPIVYNVGREMSKYVESEEWSCEIDSLYNVVVTKTYDKLFSLSDEGYKEGESKNKKVIDRYFIDSYGNFVYVEKPHFDIDYSAVIQFADTAQMTIPLDESWIWNEIALHERLEPMNILFQTSFKDFDQLSVYNYSGEEVDMVDVSELVKKNNIGYILLQKGKAPEFVPYDVATTCLARLAVYLGIEMPDSWQSTAGEEVEEENEVKTESNNLSDWLW